MVGVAPFARRADRRGQVLLVVLMALTTIGLIVISVGLLQAYQAQIQRATAAERRLQPALESGMRTWQDAAVGLMARRLGRLQPGDLDTLAAVPPTLTLPAPLVVDSFQVLLGDPQVGATIPQGAVPLWTTTDYPRTSWTQGPPLVGMRVDTLWPIRLRLAIRGEGIGRVAGEIVLGMGQIAAEQFVLRTDGPMDLCVPSDSALPQRSLVTSGAILATGPVRTECNGLWYHHGPLLGRDSLVNGAAGLDSVLTEFGRFAWAPGATTAATFWGGYTGALDAFLGHFGLLDAGAGTAVTTYGQTASRAGYGECDDTLAACGGVGAFTPALTIQRRNSDAGTAVTITCSAAVGAGLCATHQASDVWQYYARPAVPVPGEWQGLFPDPRRENRCTWASPRGNLRTFRCPTNSYGHVIRVGAALGPDGADAGTDPDTIAAGLPAIPGGLVSILGSEANAGGPGNYQEVVVLRNAEQLTGPLHLVSQLPVFIEGSFNVNAPVQPAAITAPMITVLPEQLPVQAGYALARDAAWALARDSTATARGWAFVWDSLTGLPNTDPVRLDVPGPVLPQRMTAFTPIVINAVLRSTYEPTVGGVYRGGVAEQIPAVLGDFASVTLTVNGTIHGRPAGGTWAPSFRLPGAEYSGITVIQPKGRYFIWRDEHATPTGAPPGSWDPDLYVGGAPTASRPAARQALARGGAGVAVMLAPLRRLPRGQL